MNSTRPQADWSVDGLPSVCLFVFLAHIRTSKLTSACGLGTFVGSTTIPQRFHVAHSFKYYPFSSLEVDIVTMYTARKFLYALVSTALAVFPSYVCTNFVVSAATDVRIITGAPMNHERDNPSF